MAEGRSRTRVAVAVALGRRDGLAVTIGTASAYLILYPLATRSLVSGGDSLDLIVAEEPLTLLFRRTGFLSFEPIALLDLGVARLLIAPIELLVAGGIAVLVGLNLSLSYLAWRQPAACGISPSVGMVAAVPALLSGSACCAPIFLIVLGIQASGLVVAALDVLIPLSVLLLVASLLLMSRRVEPSDAPGGTVG